MYIQVKNKMHTWLKISFLHTDLLHPTLIMTEGQMLVQESTTQTASEPLGKVPRLIGDLLNSSACPDAIMLLLSRK